jgi:hypothetical protein
MSSPKRAAKTKLADKPADKPVRRSAAARTPAKPKVEVVDGASAEAKRLASAIERSIADDKLDIVSAEALQKLIAAGCRLYAARIAAGEKFTPVGANAVTATDVMVTASGLLRAVNLAVFELGMWQNWTGR